VNQTRPIAPLAIISLAAAFLGFVGALPLPFIDYANIGGATAGVGVIGPCLLGLLSAALCLAGVIFGVIALANIRKTASRGAVPSWVAIILGGLVLAAYVVAMGRYGFAWW
jgi:hypothetical protein